MPNPQLPGLKNLVLMLAGGCNLACGYCFEQDVPIYQDLNLLTKEMTDKILDWFFENHAGQVAHIEFYGGEPLLNWEVLTYGLSKITAWAKENGLKLTKHIITNGTLLDAHRARFLVDNNFSIQISLDGDPTQNKERTTKGGRETYSKVLRAIEILKSLDANFSVRAVVKNFSPDIAAVMKHLEEIGVPITSYGTVSSDKPLYSWTDTQDVRLKNSHSKYLTDKLSSAQKSTELPANVQFIFRLLKRRQRIHYSCEAGISEVTIAPDGSIFECQRLMGNPIGNVLENTPVSNFRGEFLTPVNDKPLCKSCFARYVCGGGCKESNVARSGADEAWPAFCEMKRREVEDAVIAKAAFT